MATPSRGEPSNRHNTIDHVDDPLTSREASKQLEHIEEESNKTPSQLVLSRRKQDSTPHVYGPLHFDKCTEQLMLRRRELNEVECQQRHASRSPALKGTAEASSTVRGRSSQISTSTSRISRFRERFSPDKNAHRKGLEERPDTPILSLQGRQGLPTDQTKRPKSEIFMSNQRSYASSPSGAGTSRQRPKSEVFNNYSDITPCPPARFHTSYSTRNRRQKLPAPSTSASVSQVNHAGLYTRGELSSPISNSETMPPLTRQVPPSNHPLSGLPSTMQLPKPSAMEKIKAYFKKKGYFVPKY